METIYFERPTFSGAETSDILAEAEIHFEAGSVFAGLKLTGIQVRKGKYGPNTLFITFPAKATGTNKERRYFDHVRSVDPMSSNEGKKAVRRLRDWVESEYRKWDGTNPKKVTEGTQGRKGDATDDRPF